jgi:hypothetical protein
MIRFEQKSVKSWEIFNDENLVLGLDLIIPTINNKYGIISSFIENVSRELGSDFDNWLVNFLGEYTKTIENKYVLLSQNVSVIKAFIDKYFEQKAFDFGRFCDESKAKKTSILFTKEEIEKIIKLSSYLKVYAIFFNSENLKLDHRLHSNIYNQFAKDMMDDDIIFKVFNIVRTKTFRYNLTDRYMWDYIKMIQCKTIDVHVIEIFNFIMKSIFVLCEENKNPITFFMCVVDDCVKWFLRSVYKGTIVYDDSVSTEDVQTINYDNLKTYSFNDTLARLKNIAYEKIYDSIEKNSVMTFNEGDNPESDKSIIEFQSRVSTVKFISPLCECLVYPILSKLTSIPYEHFKTISAEHSVVLSVYVQELLNKVFKGEYYTLFSLLNYYADEDPAVSTTYQLKDAKFYLNIYNDSNFMGFNTKLFLEPTLKHFIGRISRLKLVDVLTGNKLGGIPLSKIEQDMIKFYIHLFSGKFEKEFEQMKTMLNNDF